MISFEDIKESVSDLTHEKPLLFAVLGIIILLFITGLIILMIQTSPAKKIVVQEAEPFTQDAPILIPDSPDIEKEYYQYRITENQWSKDEVNTWFSYPEESNMNELEKANDRIISNIVDSAP